MSTISIDKITIDRDIQPRETMDRATIDRYVEGWQDGDTFPPIKLYFDGESYWLADGLHRVESLRIARESDTADIDADIQDGTKQDALIYALSANRAHGLLRSDADKRRAVLLALTAFPDESGRGIARMCRVSPAFVYGLRQEKGLTPEKVSYKRQGKVQTMPAKRDPDPVVLSSGDLDSVLTALTSGPRNWRELYAESGLPNPALLNQALDRLRNEGAVIRVGHQFMKPEHKPQESPPPSPVPSPAKIGDEKIRNAIFAVLHRLKKDRIEFGDLRREVQSYTGRIVGVSDLAALCDALANDGLITKIHLDYALSPNTPVINVGPFAGEIERKIVLALRDKKRVEKRDLYHEIHRMFAEPIAESQFYGVLGAMIEGGKLDELGSSAVCLPGANETKVYKPSESMIDKWTHHVLTAMRDAGGDSSVDDIARHTGLKVSNVQAVLEHLEHWGKVRADNRYKNHYQIVEDSPQSQKITAFCNQLRGVIISIDPVLESGDLPLDGVNPNERIALAGAVQVAKEKVEALIAMLNQIEAMKGTVNE